MLYFFFTMKNFADTLRRDKRFQRPSRWFVLMVYTSDEGVSVIPYIHAYSDLNNK